MTIRIEWASTEQNAVHWIFEDQWTLAELQRATGEAETLFYSVDHTVHSLIEFSAGARFPGNVVNITRRAFENQSFSHPNTGIQFLIAPPYLAVTIIEILGKVYPKIRALFRVAISVEDALAQIRALPSNNAVSGDLA